MKQASLISLGCAKNLVDSEAMVKQLLDMGYRMTGELPEADLILINTCGFLQSAVEEAIETILKAAEHKRTGRCRTLAVAGCMVQRYGKKLVRELPEVDFFLGTSHYDALQAALEAKLSGNPTRLFIGRPTKVPLSGGGLINSTGYHTAYVKIAEGCGNSCSFCIIPHLRGPLRSRPEEVILAEASLLALEGVKEINLIAQDTTAYGLDRNDPHAVPRLLEKLEGIAGLSWIRLLYSYPDRISDLLLRTIAQSRKIVPYLDIPIQHSVPAVLKAMGRPAADPSELIDKIRSAVPGIALRTSIIAGFPGESRADFKALLSFMERTGFEHAGVFAFSPETGTRAVRLGRIPGRRTAENRRAVLLELQKGISRKKLAGRKGQVLPVLVEGPHPETELLLAGRLATQAPEVDGCVIITAGDALAGQIRNVRITATHDYDLEGVILDS